MRLLDADTLREIGSYGLSLERLLLANSGVPWVCRELELDSDRLGTVATVCTCNALGTPSGQLLDICRDL